MLDDLWRVESNAYSQDRMKKLIEMLGNAIALHIQKKIDAINVWKEDYDRIRDILDSVGLLLPFYTFCNATWEIEVFVFKF